MTEIRKLAKNVFDFLDKASSAYGAIKKEEFSHYVFSDLVSFESNSPIEGLFFIALNLQCEAFYINLNKERTCGCCGDNPMYPNLSVVSQAKIGKYRVDFLLKYDDSDDPPVVVELDGHEFHDKDKFQRSYEKARDRYLLKNGYKVIHFTGSDVCSDPHKIVFESLSMLGIPDYQVDSLEELDPNNTLMR